MTHNLESLGLDGAEFSRGYIQRWNGQDVIPEKSAQRIFELAAQILKRAPDADYEEAEPTPRGESPEPASGVTRRFATQKPLLFAVTRTKD